MCQEFVERVRDGEMSERSFVAVSGNCISACSASSTICLSHSVSSRWNKFSHFCGKKLSKVCFRCILFITFLLFMCPKLSKDGGTPSDILLNERCVGALQPFQAELLLCLSIMGRYWARGEYYNHLLLSFWILFHWNLCSRFSRCSLVFEVTAYAGPFFLTFERLQFWPGKDSSFEFIVSAVWDPSKGSSVKITCGDKKEQYTGTCAMVCCIRTLCGAALGTLTFQAISMFQTIWWSKMFAWTYQIGNFAWVVGLCF